MQLIFQWKSHQSDLKVYESEINWEYSKKKNKFFFKVEKKINKDHYMFIWFKNKYLMIFKQEEKKKVVRNRNKKTKDNSEMRDFYHKIIKGKIVSVTPPIWIPF